MIYEFLRYFVWKVEKHECMINANKLIMHSSIYRVIKNNLKCITSDKMKMEKSVSKTIID